MVWRVCVVLTALLVVVNAECPHLTVGLQRWSNASSWISNAVPVANASVVIPSGKKILLDVSPPTLYSLTIEYGGQLVWSPDGDYEIRTNYVLVRGRLDIGSEDCKFPATRKATITLLGTYGAGPTVSGFGSKFLGVAPNGTIELHGADPSPSWTKLAKTVPSVASPPATALNTLGRGFNVAMFTSDGILIEYRVYDFLANTTVQTLMANWLNAQTSGTIMAAAISDAITANSGILNTTFQSIEAFGATQIRLRNYRNSYAIIGVKGGSAVESWTNNSTPSAQIARSFTDSQGTGFQLKAQSGGWSNTSSSFAKISLSLVGQPIIDLVDEVSWKAGDKIVLASTDFSPYQSEEATLIACPECTTRQVKLAAMPEYLHFGEIVDCVDERAEVGLLTRSIVVRGEVQSSCYGMTECAYIPDNVDLFGGHFRILKGFANAHVEGVEFYKMGQQIIGSYPVHFHLCGDVDAKGGYTSPAYVKKNSIHKSLSRCVSIHGTNGLLVQDNVAFDHYGHCIFFEDGIEIRNVVDHNLALMTRFGTLIPTDRSCTTCTAMAPPGFGTPSCSECLALSTYWVTNPDNVLTNNVAGGSEYTGIWYIFPERPTGLSEALGIQLKTKPAWTAMALCANNTSHSNKRDGFFIDDGIKAGNQTTASPTQQLGKIGARYNPRVNFTDRSSARAPAIITGLRSYKNYNRGAWARGGDIWFQDCVFADNAIGATLASEGTTPNDPGSHQAVVRSLFVGQTGNRGQRVRDLTWDPVLNRTHWGDLRFPIRGFEIYDGPTRAEDNGFKNFLYDSRHNGSAVGFFLNDNWQVSTGSYLRGLQFLDNSRRIFTGKEGTPFFSSLDGDRAAVARDMDGSLTGMAGAYLVKNLPIYVSQNCYTRDDWEAQICQEQYALVFIQNLNTTATNYNNITTGYLVNITRDDAYTYSHPFIGIPTATPTIQYQPLVMLSKGFTVKFAHPTPPKLQFQLNIWNATNWARFGVCYPPANFTVQKVIGSTVITLAKVNTIQEVDNSVNGTVYFYDTTNGLLFFKAVAWYNRNGWEYCSSAGCESYRITATGPLVGTNYPCTPYPTYAVVKPCKFCCTSG